MKNIGKPFIVAATTTAMVSGLGAYIWKMESRPPVMEVYIFSLSSGRSMFIRTPEDKRILIDGGSNSEVVRELTRILPFYSRRIDAVIATNTEGRNISGLVDVVERYQIGNAYIPAVNLEVLGIASSSDQIFSTFTDTLEREGIPEHRLVAGDNLHLDGKTDMHIIFPVPQDSFAYSKASAPEMLFKISYGETSLLFLGNASNKIQKLLASTTDDSTGTNVVIVSHSALPANMSPLLFEKSQPEYLVYSKLSKNAQAKSNVLPSNKKPIKDPLSNILEDNRFNLKEKGTVKITSDGIQMKISVDK